MAEKRTKFNFQAIKDRAKSWIKSDDGRLLTASMLALASLAVLPAIGIVGAAAITVSAVTATALAGGIAEAVKQAGEIAGLTETRSAVARRVPKAQVLRTPPTPTPKARVETAVAISQHRAPTSTAFSDRTPMSAEEIRRRVDAIVADPQQAAEDFSQLDALSGAAKWLARAQKSGIKADIDTATRHLRMVASGQIEKADRFGTKMFSTGDYLPGTKAQADKLLR